jgi:hypothetical protein
LTACPGSLAHPEQFTTQPCPDIPLTLFAHQCAASGCHAAASRDGQLDLASPDLESRLVDRPASGGHGLLVDARSPDESVLYTKVTATPPFGARMPFGAAPLDDATIACLRSWVAARAVSDGGADLSTGVYTDLSVVYPDLAEADLAPSGTVHSIYLYSYLFSLSPMRDGVETDNLTVTIAVGDTVQWIWTDDYMGSGRVVSGTGCDADATPAIDSGEHVAPYRHSQTFQAAGSFPYFDPDHCDSVYMHATIVVQ